MPVRICAHGHCVGRLAGAVDAVRTPAARRGRIAADAVRHWRVVIVALMLTSAYVLPAVAAEGSLTVTISPEVAYQVREWRRAHGLPQEAEVVSPRQFVDGSGAVKPALRLIGIEEQSPDDLRISVMHVGAHWRVFVESLSDNRRYVVDVADSIANRSKF